MADVKGVVFDIGNFLSERHQDWANWLVADDLLRLEAAQ